MPAFLLLLLAIAVEVSATAALPRARGFTDLGWSLAVVAGYVLSIWLLTLVVRWMEVSVAYAVWSGLGTAAIAVVGYLWLGEPLGPAKLAGIALIVAGVVLLNLQGAAH
ncbi:multidrug efflux SMR transporter [Phycicoccus endophyticus]|uniref:Multidrug efflux SMR transporter n=1 Tax=Phycicoccus endophyticus TaxID=1690220 RepID=A0A7G9R597_9MICO|nr:multidrug efflux SMR transporter [Phycicoccus endophyticus]NHI20615.1 multidrug efflux SMR transporter [Phycicoccus endophyticus]QNN50772.1 multidrug efflux SMR transporter [Phycicoccus endophyticus]GGL43106.1 multidrug transporter [Phycicoccus endophyticus]